MIIAYQAIILCSRFVTCRKYGMEKSGHIEGGKFQQKSIAFFGLT